MNVAELAASIIDRKNLVANATKSMTGSEDGASMEGAAFTLITAKQLSFLETLAAKDGHHAGCSAARAIGVLRPSDDLRIAWQAKRAARHGAAGSFQVFVYLSGDRAVEWLTEAAAEASRFCPECAADLEGNDPHDQECSRNEPYRPEEPYTPFGGEGDAHDYARFANRDEREAREAAARDAAERKYLSEDVYLGDDIGPDDGSLARERFSDSDYRDRFESGQPMDEYDY